ILELLDLHNRTENIKNLAGDLKRNATQLQEANVDGALNLTREAYQRVRRLEEKELETQELIENAARQCKRTEILVNRTADEVHRLSSSNADALAEYEGVLQDLNERLPELNELMCGSRGSPCDDLCGGAGCGFCGGLSCEKGALTKAEKALNYAKDTEKTLREKDEQAEELIRSLSQAKTNASEAWRRANRVFNESELYYNETDDYINVARSYITNLTDVINSNTALPSEIETIADEVNETLRVIDEAKNIKTVGATGAYTKEFDAMGKKLEKIRQLLDNTTISGQDIENLESEVLNLRKSLNSALENIKRTENYLEDLDSNINLANVDLTLQR
uniref:Laminin n=1 Tax=Phlebotomus papatasi TaxID=29031 RepID=A0A1B0EZP2_PHLPP